MIRCMVLFVALVLSGCCAPRADRVTPFPPPPDVSYSKDPVIRRQWPFGNYVVTEEMVRNATLNQSFVDSIMQWKRENGIR